MEYNLGENFDWVFQALKFKLGYILGFTTWRTVLAWTYGAFSAYIAEALQNMIPEDREWANKLFNRRSYRIFVVLFRALTSVQLPKFATGKANGTGNTQLFTQSQVMKILSSSKDENKPPTPPADK